MEHKKHYLYCKPPLPQQYASDNSNNTYRDPYIYISYNKDQGISFTGGENINKVEMEHFYKTWTRIMWNCNHVPPAQPFVSFGTYHNGHAMSNQWTPIHTSSCQFLIFMFLTLHGSFFRTNIFALCKKAKSVGFLPQLVGDRTKISNLRKMYVLTHTLLCYGLNQNQHNRFTGRLSNHSRHTDKFGNFKLHITLFISM